MDDLRVFSVADIEAVQFASQAQLADLEQWAGGQCDMAHDFVFTTPNGEEHRARPAGPGFQGDWVCRRTDRPGFEGFFVLTHGAARSLLGV